MKQLIDALINAADGALVVDEKQHILFWNKAAMEILGFGHEDLANRPCYQILHGYGDGGRLICKERCHVMERVLNAKPVPNFDALVTTHKGEQQWLNISVFCYRVGKAGDKNVIVHLFHNISSKKMDERIVEQLLDIVRRYQDVPSGNGTDLKHPTNILTLRENEILTLLVRGCNTPEISQLLSISPNTTRNHIQHILQKLEVHSRLEAVAYAIQHDLVIQESV